ncbi:MAG: hypothetical protein AAGE89_13785 [Pseudomonadota bacterium]
MTLLTRSMVARAASTFLLLIAFCFIFGLTHEATAQSNVAVKRVIPLPVARPGPSGELVTPFGKGPKEIEEVFPNEDALLKLSAVMGPEDIAISGDIIWRIFREEEGPDGKLPLLGTYSGGDVSFRLPAGYYVVHGAFGYAGLAKRIKVLPPVTEHTFKIAVGGLRLNAAFRDGDFIPAKDLIFEIARQEGENLRTIVSDVRADEVIRLAPGSYHVTSRYGKINSEVSARVNVPSDKLTELTLYQRGAEITLKLVSEPGGEALANTSWTVLTPGGDTVVNTIASAFPRFVLAAGDYVAFARHDNENHQMSFTVESGVHRDVEVLME